MLPGRWRVACSPSFSNGCEEGRLFSVCGPWFQEPCLSWILAHIPELALPPKPGTPKVAPMAAHKKGKTNLCHSRSADPFCRPQERQMQKGSSASYPHGCRDHGSSNSPSTDKRDQTVCGVSTLRWGPPDGTWAWARHAAWITVQH